MFDCIHVDNINVYYKCNLNRSINEVSERQNLVIRKTNPPASEFCFESLKRLWLRVGNWFYLKIRDEIKQFLRIQGGNILKPKEIIERTSGKRIKIISTIKVEANSTLWCEAIHHRNWLKFDVLRSPRPLHPSQPPPPRGPRLYIQYSVASFKTFETAKGSGTAKQVVFVLVIFVCLVIQLLIHLTKMFLVD